jgi:fatty-acyl-CoA synthase
MKGLMMEYQLTLPTILRRAETLFGKKEIVSRLPDKKIHRYTYHHLATRAKKLAVAFQQLGIRQGDRLATLCWNHYQHLEIYFAIPCMGGVVHPLNIRFSAEDLTYTINHAGDKIIIVDQVLLPLFEKFKHTIKVSKVIVIPQTEEALPEEYLNYEDLVASGDESLFEPFEGDEYTAAFMCYTSGTSSSSYVSCQRLGISIHLHFCWSHASFSRTLSRCGKSSSALRNRKSNPNGWRAHCNVKHLA